MTPEEHGAAHVRALIEAVDGNSGGVAAALSWGQRLAAQCARGRRVLAAGNGGSAAQAQHLTAELVGRYGAERPPVSAVALHADTSSCTAIVNDYGPEEMFARQVEAHGRPGDTLLLLSTSGSSPNLVSAAKRAADAGLVTWAMTGPAPNPLADAAHEAITVTAAATSTVQEVHLMLVHVLCGGFDLALGVAEPDGRLHGAASAAGRSPARIGGAAR